MLIVAPPQGRILVIAAHPDDLESWCAGTLACAIAAGAEVQVVLVTSGDAGAADPEQTRAMVAAQREAEARTAATALGIGADAGDLVFLRYPDGEVENSLDLRADLVMAIRRARPTALFTHDPEQPYPPYLCHPDHRAVGRAALDAVYPLARDRLALASRPHVAALAPHAVADVWLFASAAAESYVDIRTGFERKLAARVAHVSQTADAEDLRRSWRARAEQIGAPVGLALAEAFTLLHL